MLQRDESLEGTHIQLAHHIASQTQCQQLLQSLEAVVPHKFHQIIGHIQALEGMQMPEIAGRNVQQAIVPEDQHLQRGHALEGVVLHTHDIVVREVQLHQRGQVTEGRGMHCLDAVEAEVQQQQIGQSLEGVFVQGTDQVPTQIQRSQLRLVLEVLGSQSLDNILRQIQDLQLHVEGQRVLQVANPVQREVDVLSLRIQLDGHILQGGVHAQRPAVGLAAQALALRGAEGQGLQREEQEQHGNGST